MLCMSVSIWLSKTEDEGVEQMTFRNQIGVISIRKIQGS